MFVTICIGLGMLSMGKMNPERRKAGSIVTTSANWLASSWLLATILISTPSERAPTRKMSERSEEEDAAAQRDLEDKVPDKDAQDQIQKALSRYTGPVSRQ